jgi:hypothetical protein
LMLKFVKTGDSLLMSLMKFSHMFRDLSSKRLSEFNSDTEKFVLDRWNRSERNSCGLVKWTRGRLLWRGDGQACATSGQMPESQCRKINIYCKVKLSLCSIN